MNLDEEGDGAIADLVRRAARRDHGRRADHRRGPDLGRHHRQLGRADRAAGRRGGAPGQFAELLDTAIANADSREQLTASRARVLTAGDEARRRVVRDLHDGAQQRLVHTIVTLKLAQRALRGDAERGADAARRGARPRGAGQRRAARAGPRDPARRSSRAGAWRAGVDAVVARIDLPVRAEVTAERLPPEIEASAYFIVAEALTNVVKHARATRAEVTATVDDGTLRIEVRDDGVGGADPDGPRPAGHRRPSGRARRDGCGSTALPARARSLTAELPLPPG